MGPIPVEMVDVEEALSNPEHPEAVRKKLADLKSEGKTELKAKELKVLVSRGRHAACEFFEPESKVNNHRMFAAPTMAKSKPLADPEQYPDKPIDAVSYLHGSFKFYQPCIEHFKQRDLNGVDADTKAEIAALFEKSLEYLKRAQTMDRWAQILQQLDEYSEQQPSLKSEPLLVTFRAIATARQDKRREARTLFDSAIEEFQLSDYPVRAALFAYNAERGYMPIINGQRKLDRYLGRAVAINYWLENDFRATPDELRHAIFQIRDIIDNAITFKDLPFIEDFCRRIEANEKIPTWFRMMSIGEAHLKRGWFFRGTDWASEVTQKGWQKLEYHCVEATGYFEKAYECNPLFPESATALAQITQLGYSGKPDGYWFSKAIEHESDFYPAYSRRIYSLVPRWGGSVEEMIEFGREFAAKKQYGTAVPFVLADALMTVPHYGDVSDEQMQQLFDNKELMSETLEALDGMLEADKEVVIENQLRGRDYLLTIKALFANAANDMQAANLAFEELDGEYNLSAVNSFQMMGPSFAMIRSRAAALTTEYQQEAKKLVELLGTGYKDRIENSDKILKLISDLSESVSDDGARLFFQSHKKQIELEKAYYDGKQITLDFDPAMMLWTSQDAKKLKYVSPETFELRSLGGNRDFVMKSIVKTPWAKTIEFEVEFPKNEPVEFRDFSVRFETAFYGNYPFIVGLRQKMGPQISQNGNEFIAGTIDFGSKHTPKLQWQLATQLKSGPQRMRVHVDEGYIEIYLNDRFILRSQSPNYSVPSQDVSFSVDRRRRGRAKVSNVKVKQWAGKPPLSEPEKLVEHYQAIAESNPDDPWPLFWQAHAVHQLKDYKKAIELYQQAIEKGVQESYASFFIGDAWDRLGDHEKAVRYYLKSFQSRPEVPDDFRILYAMAKDLPLEKSNAEQWAEFRLTWLQLTSDKPLNYIDLEATTELRLPPSSLWMLEIISLQKQLTLGEVPYLEQKLNKAFESCPAEFKTIMEPVRQSLAAGKLYKAKPSDDPLYLIVEDAVPFFRHFEDEKGPSFRQKLRTPFERRY